MPHTPAERSQREFVEPDQSYVPRYNKPGPTPKNRKGGRPQQRLPRNKQTAYGTAVFSAKYQCSFCQQLLSSSGSLRNHVIMKHTQSSNMHCPHCSRAFVSKDRLNRHKYKCPENLNNMSAMGQSQMFESSQFEMSGNSN